MTPQPLPEIAYTFGRQLDDLEHTLTREEVQRARDAEK